MNEQKNVRKTKAELWERRRLAHLKRMRKAWLRYNELVREHEELGFNRRNPFEPPIDGVLMSS